MAGQANAVTGGWGGNVSPDWGNPSNWNFAYGSPIFAGDPNDPVFNNSPSNAFGGYPYAASYTSVNGGVTIGFYSSSHVNGTMNGPGNLTVSGGILTIMGVVTLGEDKYGNDAQDGTLNIQGGTLLNAGIGVDTLTRNRVVNVTSGVLDMGYDGASNNTPHGVGATTAFNFSGGTIRIFTTATITSFSGNGSVLNLTSTLTLNCTSPGTFTGNITGTSPGNVVNSSAA